MEILTKENLVGAKSAPGVWSNTELSEFLVLTEFRAANAVSS